MKDIVDNILSQTQTLTDTSNALKQELAQSTEEILKLKSELEAVNKESRTDLLIKP